MILALLLQLASAPPVEPEGPLITVRAPLPASQQTPATMVVEPVAMLIATFDADGDGLVDRSEINAGVSRTFAASDPAGTGSMRYLAYADWALRWLGHAAALPSPFEVDRNGDNAITPTELQDHFSRLFARYDVNGDKRISRAELLTYRTAPLGANGPGGRPPRDAPPPGKPPRR